MAVCWARSSATSERVNPCDERRLSKPRPWGLVDGVLAPCDPVVVAALLDEASSWLGDWSSAARSAWESAKEEMAQCIYTGGVSVGGALPLPLPLGCV